ncbi:MAG: NAD(P)H-binding protein [Actinobacteria bacterium]|jgi:NADH dehydrogenase|nr:NAD(P)H-binding protein [Actinomycetota bacterium]
MTILVSGATGFIGSVITRHLLDAGHAVRAMSRSIAQALPKSLDNEIGRRALAEGRLTFVQADVTRPDGLPGAVRGVEAVIQAVQFTGAPIEDPRRGLTYAAVDRDGTLNLLNALASVYGAPTAEPSSTRFPAGSPRFIYVSGITVSAEATEPWNRAKWQAEEAIRGSGLDWTLVRCCWAYGPRDTALNRILGYSDYLPFVPIFGRGDDLLTPVFIEDVGHLFTLIVGDAGRSGDKTFRLGGPDEVTLAAFIKLALETRGRRRPVLHIPKALGKLQGALMQYLPGRPLTPDAVDFLTQAGAVTEADRDHLTKHFPGFETTPLRVGLATYMPGTR